MSETKGLPEITIERVVSTLVTVLVVGFFGLLWNESHTLSSSVGELDAAAKTLKGQQDAAVQVFSEEVAKLRTGLRRLETLISDGKPPDLMERVLEPADSAIRDPSALRISREVLESIQQRVRGE